MRSGAAATAEVIDLSSDEEEGSVPVPSTSSFSLARRSPLSSPRDVKPYALADVKPLLYPLHPPSCRALVPVKDEEPVPVPLAADASPPPRALPPPRLCRQFWKSGEYVLAHRNPAADAPVLLVCVGGRNRLRLIPHRHQRNQEQAGEARRGEKTMKREGWQHGAVRVNRNKLLRIADSEAARAAAAAELLSGGAYARAPTKPTNASRSTGKCRRPRCAGCHDHPVSKARDKAKGAHKLRACDVALNHRLVSWRVVDGAGACAAGTGIPDYKGASASAVLAYLAGGNSWHEDDDDDASDLETTPPAKGGLSDLYDLIVGHHADAAAPAGQEANPAHANNIAVGDADAIEEQEQDTDGDEEDDMGFCMVGITIAVEFSDGEEDWIVVEEIPST